MNAFGVAMKAHQESLDRGEDPHNIPYEFAMFLLKIGEFERGLEMYEYRGTRDNSALALDPITPLTNCSVEGRKILLHTEMGLGDFLFFLPYSTALVEAGAKVILEVPAKLVRLVQHNLSGVSGVEMIQKGDDPPFYDFEWPIGSLPLVFATRMDSIPSPPRITVPADRLEYWKHRLALQPNRKMAAICWTAGMQYLGTGQHRTVPLSNIENILGIQDVTFVSIERFLDDCDRLKSHYDFVHVGDETANDLADLAAGRDLMRNTPHPNSAKRLPR
jgi:hypothetical protein